MSTESQHLLLHAYLDGEFDAASAVAIRARIEGNTRLAAELAGARMLQRTLRERFPREPLSAPVRRRIDAVIGRSAQCPHLATFDLNAEKLNLFAQLFRAASAD